ncbi:MAG: cobalt ECF transporter T component CbiQ [Thermodesulfobacteriota bacterium]|nr:cobalt ECF transporter T component CbiQ [Thermodesulfobacteriota bacterium]
MLEEPFSRGDSFFHRANPGMKIISAAALTLVVALSRDFVPVFAGLFVSLLLLVFARLDSRMVFRRMLAVNGFIAFLWLTLPLTYGGDVLMSVGPLALSGGGVRLAALITLKSNAIFLFFIVLVATSTVAELGHGLEALQMPPKLCFLMLFTYRYLFVISSEYHRLARAAVIRCFNPGTNRHTYRTYAHLFAMTLVKSWNRSQRVRDAMLLRGFNGRFYPMREQTITGLDRVFFAGMLVTVIIIALMEFI